MANQNCEEFAVIAFWNLDRDEDDFKLSDDRDEKVKLSDDQFKC